ncbi:MAG: response regulator [Betaproteobacteria bacterium]|nr:response regulator [Betaproteobacteria bacterium]
MADTVVTVLIVDDHAVVREGLCRLIESAEGLRVAGQVMSGEDAVETYPRLRPDLVLLDLSLPGIGGVETAQRLLSRDPSARIVALSMHDDPLVVARMLRAGARGYVTKACGPDVIVDALRAVAAGRHFLSADVAQDVAVMALPGGGSPLRRLSSRELAVFRLIAGGLSLDETAQHLGLSRKTVANYQTSLRQKLALTTSAQATRLAIACGMMGSEAPVGTANPVDDVRVRKNSGT